MVILLDLAAIAILVFFAWQGKTKGFILTAFGLLSVAVALLGASLLSDLFSKPLGGMLEPFILQKIEQLASEFPDIGNLQFSLPSVTSENENEFLHEIQPVLDQLLSAAKDSPLISYLVNSLNTALTHGTVTILAGAASITTLLAQQFARAILFFLFFIIILILWWLLSRAVNLAFHLPILRGLNEIGGLLLGLIKGALLLLVACWALVSLGIVHIDAISSTYFLSIFLNFHIV